MDIAAVHAGMGPEALTRANAQLTTDKTKAFADKLQQASEKLQQSNNEQDKKRLWAACQDMEAVFLNLMLSRMRATVPKSTLFGEDSNEYDIVQSMLDSEMTKNLSKAGGIGLANMLYKQLSATSVGSSGK